MTGSDDIMAVLSRTQAPLSKSYQRLAQYITAHPDTASTMNAAQLAREAGVSESTAIRFSTAIGYAGFPDMRKALAEVARHRMTTVQRANLHRAVPDEDALTFVLKADMKNLKDTLESVSPDDFKKAVEGVSSARTVYVLGLRSASPLAQYMSYYLHFMFDDVRLVAAQSEDVLESVSRIGKEDVIIGISFPRYSQRTLEAMEYARRAGARVVGITDGARSPLQALCHVCLTVSINARSFVDSFAAPFSLAHALLLALSQRKKAALNEYLRSVEALWQAHQTYTEKENA